MAKSVISLNGQTYDSATGKLLGSTPSSTAPFKMAAQPATQAPRHLDGFTRRPASAPRPATKAVHQQPQKSKTLMRSGVKKPVTPAKIHAKAPATTAVASKKAPTKEMLTALRPGRVIRANNTPKSNFISKFGVAAATIKSEVLPVASEPKVALQSLRSAPPTPTRVQSIPQPAQPNPFTAALEHANSHEQAKIKKAKVHHRIAKKLRVSPKVVSFASFTILALAISGFVAYQNLPEIAMRVAATRAGFSASLPTYQPSGFSMAGPIEYQPGEVTLSYKSASDNRSFNVVQKNSSWNSETLLENFVAVSGKPYQTFQANGRTIYIYDDNKATWVDGGIWYNIDGKSNLNSDQLLRIASSL